MRKRSARGPVTLAGVPLVAVAAALLIGRTGRGCRRADAVRPVLRQEQDPLRQLRVAHLHDRPLRDLLLPGDRAAPRADHQLRRERLPAGQLRPEARPRLQGPARPLQDAERVPAAEHRAERAAGRRARLRRAVPRPHGAADRRAVRRALPADHARADAHLRVRHHPALAAPPRPAAVGRRGARRSHDRLLEPVRPDDGARRGDLRHDPADERLPGRGVRRRPPALQPRSRRVRVHRVALGQGRAAAVPVRAAQERHRRRRERLRGSVPAQGRRVRRAVRQVPEGPLQAVPRQGAAGGLRPQPRAEAREDAVRRGRLDRAVAVGRPDGGRGRQPQGSGARHRPDVDQGRQGHPQPDRRLQQGQGLRVHRHARRLPQQRRAVDVVGAGRRSHRLLRAHREGQDAHPAERRHPQDREADRAEDRSTCRSRRTSARTARRSPSRP